MDGSELCISPYGSNILIAGSSGGGKSSLAAAFLERLEEQHYQFLIVDPEGDYSSFTDGIVIGDEKRPPSVTEALDVIAKPEENVTLEHDWRGHERKAHAVSAIAPTCPGVEGKDGTPALDRVDEAHHVLPSSWKAAGLTVSQSMDSLMLITLEPDRVSPAILSTIDVVIAVGEDPDNARRFRRHRGRRGALCRIHHLE